MFDSAFAWMSANQGNLTTIIAIGGFIISCIALTKTFMQERVKLRGTVTALHTYQDNMLLRLMLENHSTLPVAVTGIDVDFGEKHYSCEPISRVVFAKRHLKNGKEVSCEPTKSTQLPVQLQGLGASPTILAFSGVPETPQPSATHLSFSVHTNRGKTVKMRLALPEQWASQKIFP